MSMKDVLERSAVGTAIPQAKGICLYGDSGLGKTTQLAIFAKWLYEHTGKPTRVISAEDSSKSILEPLIAIGIVDFYLIGKKQTLAELRNLSEGKWLVNGTWQPYKPGSHAGYGLDGLSSIAETLMEEARENHRFLQGQTQNVYTLGNKEIGEHKVSAATQQGYGFVQDEMLRAVKAFASLEGVQRVFWTAHEVKSEDADHLQLRGPMIVGKAKTPAVQKYFGMVLHIDGYVDAKDKTTTTRKIWFTRHPDLTINNIYYPAKVTIPLQQVEKLMTKFPGGFIIPTPTFGIDALLDAEVELQSAETNNLRAWKEEIDRKFKQ